MFLYQQLWSSCWTYTISSEELDGSLLWNSGWKDTIGSGVTNRKEIMHLLEDPTQWSTNWDEYLLGNPPLPAATLTSWDNYAATSWDIICYPIRHHRRVQGISPR